MTQRWEIEATWNELSSGVDVLADGADPRRIAGEGQAHAAADDLRRR